MIALPLLIIHFVLPIPAPAVWVPPVGVLAGPAAPVAMAPDGSWIAFVSTGGIGDILTQSEGMGRVQVWDLRTGTLDRSFPAPSVWRSAAVTVSPDGRWLAYPGYANNSRAILVYDFRTGKGVRTIAGVGDDSHPIGFSADGKEMYSSAHDSANSTHVAVWSTADGSKLREVKIPNSYKVTMSSDGKTAVLFLNSRSGGHEIWDLAEGKKLGELGRRSSLGTKPVFVRGGKALALLYDGQFTAEFQVWDPVTRKLTDTIKVPVKEKWPRARVIAGDLSALAVRDNSGEVRVYEVGKTEPRFTFDMKTGGHEGPVFTPDGKRLIAIRCYERAWVLDAVTGKPAFTLEPDYRSVKSLAFTPDGKTLVAGVAHWPRPGWGYSGYPDEGYLMTWDLTTGELKRAVRGLSNFVHAVYPSPKADKAVVVNCYQLVHGVYCQVAQAEWWDLAAGKQSKVLARKDEGFSSFGGSADGRKFAAIAPPGKVHTAAVEPAKVKQWIADLDSPKFAVREAAEKELSARLGPSLPYLRETANKTQSAEQRARVQKLLAQWDAQRNVGVERAEIWVWDPATGEPFPSLPGTSSGHPVRFTPDGEWLITQNGNDGVQVFRTAGGRPTAIWRTRGSADDNRYPTQPVPLPGGTAFVAFKYGQYSYGPRDLYWYDFGRQIKFGSTDRTVTPLVLSPDGKWVAAGGLERDKPNPVYLWKLPDFGPLDEKLLYGGKTIPASEQLAKLVKLDGHLGEVFAVAFSPDGKTLATGGRDRVIRLWDVATGKLRASLWSMSPLEPDGGPTEWAAFTPDGFHNGSARGRACLRFAGESAPLFKPEKVRVALVRR